MLRVVTTDEVARPLEFSPDNTSSLREAWILVSLRGFFRCISLDCSLFSSFTGFIYNKERVNSTSTNQHVTECTMQWQVPERSRNYFPEVLRKLNRAIFSSASRRNLLPRVILGKMHFCFSFSCLLSMFFEAVVCVACFLFFACRVRTHRECTESVQREQKIQVTVISTSRHFVLL
jgi:hypothetical protein